MKATSRASRRRLIVVVTIVAQVVGVGGAVALTGGGVQGNLTGGGVQSNVVALVNTKDGSTESRAREQVAHDVTDVVGVAGPPGRNDGHLVEPIRSPGRLPDPDLRLHVGPPSSANTRKRPPGGRAGVACQPCSTLSGRTGLGKAASADQGLGLSVDDGDGDAAGVSEGAGDGFAVSVELGLGSVLTVGLGEGSVGPGETGSVGLGLGEASGDALGSAPAGVVDISTFEWGVAVNGTPACTSSVSTTSHSWWIA